MVKSKNFVHDLATLVTPDLAIVRKHLDTHK